MSVLKEPQLWAACTRGDLDAVKLLLATQEDPSVDVDVNWSDPEHQRAPLHRACFFGHLPVVEFLLRHPKVAVNALHRQGATPFFFACQNGHGDVVSLLLADDRINFGQARQDGTTPLSQACWKGHAGVVSLLLADGRIEVNRMDDEGCSPLFVACQEGREEVVSLLLADERVNVNLATRNKATPFLITCENGHLNIASMLLANRRVEPNLHNSSRATPVFLACQNGHHNVVSLLLASRGIDFKRPMDGGATPFLVACARGHYDVVSLLVGDNRIDINAHDDLLCSPLWMATHNGHLGVVQQILASGVQVNTQARSLPGSAGWRNKTAIEIARLQGTEPKRGMEDDERYTHRIQQCPPIVALLEKFEVDPESTRRMLRELPRLRESFAGEVFTLIVFICDDLLNIRPDPSPVARFFHITVQLPMELQMVLCNRVFGSGKDNVLTKCSEPAFRKLAHQLSLNDIDKNSVH